ncbi:MAG: hypothetical protein GWP12_01800 [Nitrospirae bacterium]|nr:hypothetical protein [Nitrospirota bacterium]
MPTKIHFPGTSYSQNKVAIKASFPKSCKWDMKGRKGWFGIDLAIIAHLRSGEPGTLYLEGKPEYIGSIVNACKEIVDSCQVEVVDLIPDFQPFSPGMETIKKEGFIDLSTESLMKARIKNERVKLEAAGMSEDFIKKWITIIEKECQKDNEKPQTNISR